MHIIKYTFVVINLILYLITGCILRLVLIKANPNVYIRAINRLTYYLMHSFKLIGGFKIKILGNKDVLKEKGLFIISTHVGYIDGIILGTLAPGTFTTKGEIKTTPFLGQIVSLGKSIFINRERKNQIVDYVHQMTNRLSNKINVFCFPEGHASDGTKILKFFPAFFDAPLKAATPIIPVSIDYQKINGKPITNRDAICCYDGKVSIFKHLWGLLKFRTIDVTIQIHDRIQPNGFQGNSKDRRLVSDLCMKRFAEYTKLPIADDHPLVQRAPSAPITSETRREEPIVR